MSLYNPMMKWMNPRDSGLICFKGDGASAAEVETIVDDKLGTPSEGLVTSNTESTMNLPTTVVDPVTGEVTTGTNPVTFGGNENVAVTETVKGDTEALLGGQDKIGSQIDAGLSNFQPVNVTNTTIDTSNLAKSAAMDAGFARSISNQDKILADTGQIGGIATDVGNIQTGVGDIKTTLGGPDRGLVGDVATIGTNVGQLGTDVGLLSDDIGVTADSGSITSQLAGLGTDVTNIGRNELDTTGVSDRFTDVDTAVSNADVAAREAFERLMGADPSQVQGFLGELQRQVLLGQTNAQTAIDTIKRVQAENQVTNSGLLNNISTSVGGSLAADFGDFTGQYATDTNLATNARSELQKQITGGVDTLQRGQGQQMSQSAAQAEAAANQAQSVEQKNSLAYGQIMRDLSDVNKQVGADQATDVLARLGTIRQILQSQGNNIEENTRREYQDLANAFDQTGKLITQSVEQNGNVTRRGMDDQNNLLIASFDSSGKLLSQTTRDIGQLLSQMDRLGYQRQGGQFGDLSANGLGLMDGRQNQSPIIRQN
jgi:hypothetical protein